MTINHSTFVDEQGHPRLRSAIVGFLDLLGFSHQVMTSKSSQDSQKLLDRIVSAIADSRKYARQAVIDDFLPNPAGWAVKYFSDNLTLGYAYDDNSDASRDAAAWFVIRCAQRYQFRMALNGLFLRGGVTYGPLCITDDIIFGSSLIDCYQLESKISIVPRVILAEPLQQMVTASFHNKGAGLPVDAADCVCRDVDGWWFINYLQAAVHDGVIDWPLIDQHKQSVLESLSSTTRHDVLPKFGWACRYHNMFCHWHRDAAGYSDRYRIDRADEQSKVFRLGDANKDS